MRQQVIITADSECKICNGKGFVATGRLATVIDNNYREKWLNQHKAHRLAVMCEYETFDKLEERLALGKTYWEYSK